MAVVSNVTGAWLTAEEATSVDYWVGHMRRPVRFAEGVRTVNTLSAPLFIEVGPGRTLASFIGQVNNRARTVTSLPHPQQPRSAVEHVIDAAAQLWVAGVDMDWSALVSRERRQLVPLPTYAFQRQRYWIDRAAVQGQLQRKPATLVKSADIGSWCYVPVWQRSEPPAPRQWRHGEVCLLFEDQEGVGDELSQRLETAGCTVVRVLAGSRFARMADGSYTIDPASPDDYDALLDALHAGDFVPVRIAHLWALDASANDYDFERAGDLTFYSVLFLTQALVRHGLDTVDLAVIGNGWASVQRDDDIQPAMSPVLALCTVIGQEHPDIRVSTIDVTVTPVTVAGIADQLFRELQSDFDGVPIAYRGPQRWVQSYEQVTTAAGWSGALRTRGVYVITGGLGSVGLALARRLAGQYSARLVLIGRTLPPPRREWDAWLRTHGADDRISKQIVAVREIEAAGGEVRLHAADVADATRLRAVFAEIADWFGRIDGVIHAAGQTTGAGIGPIASLDRDACEAQFRSKIDGLHSLAEAVADIQPGFCALTSSLSSILGGLGFGAYAAANRYMDAFAEASNRRNSRWLSIASDAWAFTDSRSALAELAMTASEGVLAIERVIESTPAPRVVISTGSLEARIDRYVRRSARHAVAPPALAAYARPDTADYEPPADDAERMMAEVWQEMIGVDRVGRDDDFFKLGGHSLLATRVIAHVKQRCGVELALKAFFERPRLRELAERVSELQWVAQGRSGGVGLADREEIEI